MSTDLNPSAALDAAAMLPKKKGDGKEAPHPPKDLIREVKETIVFVVVLVLLLKLFVAEAFVIPTGSMAETLRGDHARATCPQCRYPFVVNNAEQGGSRMTISWIVCPNCGYRCNDPSEIRENVSSWTSGDRVLVSKFQFALRDPHRFDVPVFKYPVEPYTPRDHSAMNYIKRLVGLGGETIAVYKGDLYVTRKLKYEHRERPKPEPAEAGKPARAADELDLWKEQYMYVSDREALKLFDDGEAPDGFRIIRKTPDQILAVRRIVFDLDHQPQRPKQGPLRTRWDVSANAGDGWQMQEMGFDHKGEAFGWMRYQHFEPAWETLPSGNPSPIRDFLGYNAAPTPNALHYSSPQNWVPDLIVECRADVESENAEIVLELNKSGQRYQARFAGGECQLIRIDNSLEKSMVLGTRPSGIKGKGRYHLRFANVDSRLTVWVDKKALPFGDEAEYATPDRINFRETPADIDRPVRIGAKGDVRCSRVQIWRDVYYTCSSGDCSREVQTFYVQPNHYLMFGDNSASSSDSRTWGTVPERLMLGRAVVVYWPFKRIGIIE